MAVSGVFVDQVDLLYTRYFNNQNEYRLPRSWVIVTYNRAVHEDVEILTFRDWID